MMIWPPTDNPCCSRFCPPQSTDEKLARRDGGTQPHMLEKGEKRPHALKYRFLQAFGGVCVCVSVVRLGA